LDIHIIEFAFLNSCIASDRVKYILYYLKVKLTNDHR
jgi:hypothetical protein